MAAETPSIIAQRGHTLFPLPMPSEREYEVAQARTIIEEHERGIFCRSAPLARAMRRNPRIFSALQTRILGVLGLPFSIERSRVNRPRSEVVRRRFEERYSEMMPRAAIELLLEWHALLGVAFAQKVWRTDADGEWVPRVEVIDPSYVYWSTLERCYRVTTLSSGSVAMTPDTGDWIIVGSSWMHGVVRCLGIEDSLRLYAVRDWARWSERHGLPVIDARVPVGASDRDKRDYFRSLANLGSDATVYSPQLDEGKPSFGFDFKEPKNERGWSGFQALIEHSSNDCAIAILGGNLTSKVDGGSLAAAQVHDRVRGDILESDAGLIDGVARNDVAVPFARYNAGDERLAPVPHYDAERPQDRVARAEGNLKTAQAVEVLVRSGAPANVREMLVNAGIPTTDESAKPQSTWVPSEQDVVRTIGSDAPTQLSALPFDGPVVDAVCRLPTAQACALARAWEGHPGAIAEHHIRRLRASLP